MNTSRGLLCLQPTGLAGYQLYNPLKTEVCSRKRNSIYTPARTGLEPSKQSNLDRERWGDFLGSIDLDARLEIEQIFPTNLPTGTTCWCSWYFKWSKCGKPFCKRTSMRGVLANSTGHQLTLYEYGAMIVQHQWSRNQNTLNDSLSVTKMRF